MKALNTTWKHMRRSPYQSMAAVLTMFVTLLLAGIFALASLTSALILQYFESRPQITVFFTDKSTDEDVNALKTTLVETGKVAETNYVSKDQALGIYREQIKNDPLLLEMVTAEILPASLEVSPKDPAYLPELNAIIKEAQGVEDVTYQKEVVDALLVWTRAIRIAGISLVGLLAFDSILIIMTVIGMKIAIKKEEIDIMKLIGASPWYIRWPFVLEGGLYGALGGFVGWSIIAGLILWLRPFLLSFLGIIPAIQAMLLNPSSVTFWGPLAAFLGLLTLTGFLLGSVGSMIALGRFIRF